MLTADRLALQSHTGGPQVHCRVQTLDESLGVSHGLQSSRGTLRRRGSASLIKPLQRLSEAPRAEDGDAPKCFDREQVVVTRDDDFNLPGHCRRQYPVIVWVAADA